MVILLSIVLLYWTAVFVDNKSHYVTLLSIPNSLIYLNCRVIFPYCSKEHEIMNLSLLLQDFFYEVMYTNTFLATPMFITNCHLATPHPPDMLARWSGQLFTRLSVWLKKKQLFLSHASHYISGSQPLTGLVEIKETHFSLCFSLSPTPCPLLHHIFCVDRPVVSHVQNFNAKSASLG